MTEIQHVEVVGFAKGNGKTVHIILRENVPLCEAYLLKSDNPDNKTARILQPEDEFSLKDVTCKKCQRSTIFKEGIQNEELNKNEIVKEDVIKTSPKNHSEFPLAPTKDCEGCPGCKNSETKSCCFDCELIETCTGCTGCRCPNVNKNKPKKEKQDNNSDETEKLDDIALKKKQTPGRECFEDCPGCPGKSELNIPPACKKCLGCDGYKAHFGTTTTTSSTTTSSTSTSSTTSTTIPFEPLLTYEHKEEYHKEIVGVQCPHCKNNGVIDLNFISVDEIVCEICGTIISINENLISTEEKDDYKNESDFKESPIDNFLSLRQIVDRIKGQFIGIAKTNDYVIVHKKSKQIFFDHVPPKAILNTLFMINTVNVEWNGEGSPGTDYLSLVRKAFAEGYKISSLEYPEKPKEKQIKVPKLTRLNKTPVPKLTRLKKEKEHKMKRPKSKTLLKERLDCDFLFRNGTPKSFIVEILYKRCISKKDIIERTMKKFNMKRKEARELFETTIYQVVRIKGVNIDHFMNSSKEENDLYSIKPEISINKKE